MIKIKKASIEDAALIAEIGKTSFMESHSKSAPMDDLEFYLKQKFKIQTLQAELEDKNSHFHIIYFDNIPAGYSKIIPNSPNPSIKANNVTKLERLYLLKEFLGQNIGRAFFEFNIQLSKELDQSGIWLYVWTGNDRAIKFYEKMGFINIGMTEFKLSEKRANPNYWMYLEY
jgi:ribosomal protein S18 acetylase RimI-like enzyme